MPTLLDSLTLGALELPNRIIMSPLTRCRASAGRVPNALMTEYYVQRASAGLILSEAVAVTPQGVGYPDTPGLWTAEQVTGWKNLTNALHHAGGRIFAQLWHVGRISDPIYLDGDLPVAPSAIAAAGHVKLVRPERPYITPRALALHELPGIVAAFRQGAENALAAGFDGVEIHAANGYLIDQFLQDRSNRRDDAYGGSIENRARLLLEITDAVIDVWGAGRVGVHLAPACDTHDVGDSDPAALFGYVARALGQRRIAFIFTREAQGEKALSPALKRAFDGILIANQGLDKASANALLATGAADAAAFGVPFIANPDLPRRIAKDAPWNPPRPEFFYGSGATGYTDYPVLP
ncbi:MAG: alkene reductase [Zoogloeaceae bacterium]|jgi:N-ethylmaleimide reductase|nr:alkene reductase [Zoogloeaceae bacterium]